MRGVAIFIIGLSLLLGFGIIMGRKVFPPVERALAPGSLGAPPPIFSRDEISEEEWNLRKARFAFSSFDLVSGLTIRELEGISSRRGSRLFAFLSLLAVFWLVRHLRKPGSLP